MMREALRRARDEASWQQWALLGVGLACAIAVRFALGPLSTGDYTHFMKGWIEVLREQGFAVDYVEDRDGRRLGAVHLGDVRLIDNVLVGNRS